MRETKRGIAKLGAAGCIVPPGPLAGQRTTAPPGGRYATPRRSPAALRARRCRCNGEAA